MELTDRQLDLMNILWSRGSATVREARGELDADLAYTSVLTVFQTLERNGQVRHEREGRAYRYFPTRSREEAGRDAIAYVLDRLFQGSAPAMAEAVLDVAEFDEDENAPAGEILDQQLPATV